ncbi:hypothetical protein AGMMS49592_0300 [Endomicrobiia bacterium]|nr:hypothetical protein AGMMS49592_0300 [Endomicrobiia bacterium]
MENSKISEFIEKFIKDIDNNNLLEVFYNYEAVEKIQDELFKIDQDRTHELYDKLLILRKKLLKFRVKNYDNYEKIRSDRISKIPKDFDDIIPIYTPRHTTYDDKGNQTHIQLNIYCNNDAYINIGISGLADGNQVQIQSSLDNGFTWYPFWSPLTYAPLIVNEDIHLQIPQGDYHIRAVGNLVIPNPNIFITVR